MRDLTYGWYRDRPPVLNIDRLDITSGTTVFIEGPSGSGKTTLLNLLAGVVVPRSGTVTVLGCQLEHKSGAERDRVRADSIGFIFQQFNLLPYLSVVENVTLPCQFSKRRRDRAVSQSGTVEKEATRLLEHLDMAELVSQNQPASNLSVGQQQRVAAARALMGNPDIVIADEPTSSLDFDRREAFIKLLFAECRREGSTLVFVSHDRTLAHLFDRTIHLGDINHVGVGHQT
ncbi:MAG: ABC transporter ATP-binding protein [Cyanobacteria bacterium P01_E01_bin.34]